MNSTTIDSILLDCEKLRYSNPVEAYTLAQKAYKKALKSKDPSGLAHADMLKASLARTLGDMKTAESCVQSALLYYRAKKLEANQANCLILIGQNITVGGNYNSALGYFVDAERLAAKSPNHADIMARAIGLQGQSYLNLGRPVEALKFLLKSLHISEECDLIHQRGISLQNIASFYMLEHDYSKSIQYSTEALPFLKTANDKYSECYVLNNIGIVHSYQHRPNEAVKYFKWAYKLAIGLAIPDMTTWTLSNLIEQQIMNKKIKEAGLLLKKLILLSGQETDMVSKASILSSAASFYLSINKPKIAIKNLISALEILSPLEFGRVQVLETLIEVYFAVDDMGDAIQALKEYLRLKDKLFNISIQREINLLEAKRNPANASQAGDEKLEKYALHRLEKTEFIQSLKKKFAHNRNIESTLIHAMASQISEKTDAFDHELYLSMTYNDFMMRLSKKIPSLTITELKISTLLRLNMPSKKIATLLSLSVRTVEFHRVNIRKKLSLKTKDNVQLVLMKI